MLSARQVALDKRLDRVLCDVETKSTNLARFSKSDYKPFNENTVEKYLIWSRRCKDQLDEHGLDRLLYRNYTDMYADIMSISAHDDLFNDQPALCKEYQYLLGKVADLATKQLKFIKNVFEDVFRDSSSSLLIRVPNSLPYKIWDDIVSAFTTVTRKKSAKAIGNVDNLKGRRSHCADGSLRSRASGITSRTSMVIR